MKYNHQKNNDSSIVKRVKTVLEEYIPELKNEVYIPVIHGHHMDLTIKPDIPFNKEDIYPSEGTVAVLYYNYTTNDFQLKVVNLFYHHVELNLFLILSNDKKSFIPISNARGRVQKKTVNHHRSSLSKHLFPVECENLIVYIRRKNYLDTEFLIYIPISENDLNRAICYEMNKNNILPEDNSRSFLDCCICIPIPTITLYIRKNKCD